MKQRLFKLGMLIIAFNMMNHMPLYSQLTFDPGESEIILANHSGGNQHLWFTIAGLVFNCNLELSVDYIGNGSQYVLPGNEVGLDVCWDSSGTVSGDVEEFCAVIACGEYRFIAEYSQVSYHLILNLIDAKWGAATSTDDIYKIYLDYVGNGEFEIHVQDPVSGDWREASGSPFSSGSTVTYWDLVRDTWDEDYERERTVNNGKYFTTSLPGLPPDPSMTQVKSAELDVNLTVEEDATVCDDCALTINPFDEGSAGTSQTIVKFDNGAGLIVEGELHVGLENYYGEYVTLKPSSSPSYPGDWDGVVGSDADYIFLDRAFISRATCGVNLENCDSVDIRRSLIQDSDDEGINLESSTANLEAVVCESNGGTNLRITSSTAFVDTSIFTQSLTSNGITVDDVGYLRMTRSLVNHNRGHGVVGTAYARMVIDSCQVSDNGFVAGVDSSDAYGIYSFYNGWLVSVRRSVVHGNMAGLAAYFGTIAGYYTPSFGTSATYSNPDSVAMNCIFSNDYNIYGYYGRYEMARILNDPGGTPHYQGNQSSIYFPLRYQVMMNNSTAHLARNYWHNDHVFLVVNSMVNDRGELANDVAGCVFDTTELGTKNGTNTIAASLSLYRSWESLPADSVQAYVVNNLHTITAGDVNEALYQLRGKMIASAFEVWLEQLIKKTTKTEVLIPAYGYLAAVQMQDESWTDAVNSYLSIAGLSPRAANSDYTRAHAMAALTMSYGGDGNAGKTSLDSLLRAFPGDRDLTMVWTLIDGSVLSPNPKARSHEKIASEFALSDAYPNPFRQSTMISVTVPKDAEINLSVYDCLGRHIRSLVDGYVPAGTHTVQFDAANLNSGVYFYRLLTNGTALTKRVTVLK